MGERHPFFTKYLQVTAEPRRGRRMRRVFCPIPGCENVMTPTRLMCPAHWRALPLEMRKKHRPLYLAMQSATDRIEKRMNLTAFLDHLLACCDHASGKQEVCR